MNEQAMGEYVQWLRDRGKRPNTITNYAGHVRRLAHWLEQQGVQLLAAERHHLKTWRSQLAGETATVMGHITAARSFYYWATLEEHMDRNPTLGVPVPSQRRRLPRPIADDDMIFSIDMATGRTRQWLVLEGYMGLRACEIATLHRSRIYNTAQDPYLVAVGKGGKERPVPISPYVWSEIRVSIPRRGYLYLRKDRTNHVSAAVVTKACNDHLRACGFDETAHQLRHRFGTEVQRAIKDIRVTQELMGHSDPKTTAGYAQVSSPDAIAAVLAVQPKGWRDGLRSIKGE